MKLSRSLTLFGFEAQEGNLGAHLVWLFPVRCSAQRRFIANNATTLDYMMLYAYFDTF